MRSNSTVFDEFNQASRKELRLVIVIDFPTPLYLTSHSGITDIPAGAIDDVIQDVSSTSQRLVPDEGRSEIGSLSFSVVDVAGAITNRFRTEQAAGNGLKGRKVELYRGGAGMSWNDFRIEQTPQIDADVMLRHGAYQIKCADIQRELRRDIFDLAKTRLAATLSAAGTTLEVFDTSDFEVCSHVASFGDEPAGSWYYLKIKYQNGFEIIKASGKTATTFTGLTRGMFGTEAVEHVLPAASDADSGVEIQEYVYLELPAPAMAYALLTGNIIGGGTIPWHLDIDPAFVDQDSFQNIGQDWFDSSDYSEGLIFRFQGVGKTDGKRFIEREVCLLAGAFLRIGADGKIYMRRMTGVIGTADHVLEIGVDNAIAHGPIRHDLAAVRNIYDVEWSWLDIPGESKPRFVRRNILLDAVSIALHGEAKPLALQFKGLHAERHTRTTLANRFDALRDRYAGPPIRFSVDLLPSLNDLEVGDIVRAVFPNVRDYSGDGSLDRAFEVERLQVNQKSGRVTAELFGSTLKASPITDDDSAAELPDAWYSSFGTDMGASLSIDVNGFLEADGTLAGGTTTRTAYYYLGDFTIPAGRTLTLTGNVQLHILGHFQKNGTLRVSGGMPSNTAGYLGSTYGGRAVLIRDGVINTVPGPRRNGSHQAMPVLEIENRAGVLVGIPGDMRGSGGANGGNVWEWDAVTSAMVSKASGGAGGIGGGSVVIVCRGAGYGVSGETDLSGEDGSAGSGYLEEESGSGGGGAPGGLLYVLDGAAVTVPILSGTVVAEYGTSPITLGNADTQGKARADDPVNLGPAAARIVYVPKSRDPYPDAISDALLPSGTDGADGTLVEFAFQRATIRPATPTGDGIPVGWSDEPISGSDPLWVSTAKQELDGTTIGSWSTPIRMDASAGSSAMNVGRRMNSLDQWYNNDSQSFPISVAPLWSIEAVAGPVWSTVLRGVDNVDTSRNIFSERMTIDPSKRHRVSIWARQPSGDRNNFLLVAFYDDAGANISGSSGGATGWSGLGGYHYWQIVNADFAVDFTLYSFEFGGGATATIPTGAAAMAIGVLGLRTGTTETTIELQDYYVIEIAEPGDDGLDGDDPITGFLSNEAHVVSTNADGTSYSLTGAGGTFKVFNGITDVTGDPTYSVVGSATKNGLTISISNTTGVYTLSGASWSSDSETFTLRAVYDGVTIDKTYTIAKSKQGASPDGFVKLAISYQDSQSGALPQSAGIVFTTDGLVKKYANGSLVQIGTWWTNAPEPGIGNSYQVRNEEQLAGSWDVAAAVVGTWFTISSDATWRVLRTVMEGAGTDVADSNFQIRKVGEDTIDDEAIGSADAGG